MRKKNFNGKSLREEMIVIVSKAWRWAEMKAGGTPLKVVSIEYPFVVFEVTHPERTMNGIAAMIGLPMLTGSEQQSESRMVRDTFAADVRWCRFSEVSDAYIEAYRQPTTPVGEPGWLKGE